MRLVVLQFNVEYGGGLVSLDRTVEAIRLADADVVGLAEPYRNLRPIADAAGYAYHNVSLQLLSRHPIWEPSGSDGLWGLVEVRPGRFVVVCNVHLDDASYGPAALLAGEPPATILAREGELRDVALRPHYDVLPRLAADGYPVLLLGDFNEPSSLDYVAATVGSRPQVIRAVPWPVSARLLSLGFRDSWREAHPDPVADPGLTWPAARPAVAAWAGEGSDPEPHDRIDYIYAAGPCRTQASVLVGEQGTPGVAVSVDPWPSDHRGVLSTFEIDPLEPAALLGVTARSIGSGETLGVATLCRAAGSSVEIRPEGAATASLREAVAAGGARLEVTLDPARYPPGGYRVTMRVGDELVADVPVRVRDPQAALRLATDHPAYEVGEPIEVRWTDGPANR
ncbi:MAG TPA: endonuclease/exonuclease/phosphatase family protein, partial [Thermoleophilia bacterium]|nr:endonuclease/exonuclease/phosphatase family protein [Thermoleophilia bacterium]